MTASTTTETAGIPFGRGRRPSASKGGRWSHPKMTAEQQKEATEKITHRYVEEKKTIRAIAAELGHSYGTVHRLLEAAGVQRRAHGGNRLRRATVADTTPEAGPTSGQQQ